MAATSGDSSRSRTAGSVFRPGRAVSRGWKEQGEADPVTADLTLEAVGATEQSAWVQKPSWGKGKGCLQGQKPEAKRCVWYTGGRVGWAEPAGEGHEQVSPGHGPGRGTQPDVRRLYVVAPVLGEEGVGGDGWGSPVEGKSWVCVVK